MVNSFYISTCENGTCLCPIGYYGNNCEHIITDCSHGHELNWSHLGQMLSFVKPSLSPEPFEILCHFDYLGIAHALTRHSSCIPDYYNRTYSEYRQGFGDASTSHWIGLDKFYQMSKERNNFRLNIYFYTGLSAQCYYNQFSVMDVSDQFKLQVSGFTSHSTEICSDSWTNSVNINNAPFSTFDNDTTPNDCPNKMAADGSFSALTSPIPKVANFVSNNKSLISSEAQALGSVAKAGVNISDAVKNLTNLKNYS
ncbi:hypothetical protein LOTGIDRAFT_161862 [Lottia gigantea]|uniref:Fibrinogen C-terminal domain-containing protein n=1 Tax=Lottia gigantea TaxID=225164 RepID=V4AII9_LOTGI|nr:hypothetical protein LOTGIDRAFT_161862 [Lottia gigantea]ESO93296.1 hypothetical protein LOTGIDRAFT_161862 [Lottia gigantea]